MRPKRGDEGEGRKCWWMVVGEEITPLGRDSESIGREMRARALGVSDPGLGSGELSSALPKLFFNRR